MFGTWSWKERDSRLNLPKNPFLNHFLFFEIFLDCYGNFLDNKSFRKLDETFKAFHHFVELNFLSALLDTTIKSMQTSFFHTRATKP